MDLACAEIITGVQAEGRSELANYSGVAGAGSARQLGTGQQRLVLQKRLSHIHPHHAGFRYHHNSREQRKVSCPFNLV